MTFSFLFVEEMPASVILWPPEHGHRTLAPRRYARMFFARLPTPGHLAKISVPSVLGQDISAVTSLNEQLLSIFIPTFFLVSLTPGMCMTLSMSLGITVGVRRATWMMMGELIGVGLVAVSAVVGVASLMFNYPTVFAAFRYLGGGYLVYLGAQMWLSHGRMALSLTGHDGTRASRLQLAFQGFVTAVANPKGWAFFIVLLPPFINSHLPIAPQLGVLTVLILSLELLCLLIYAAGGRTLNHVLQRGGHILTLNRIAGTLMVGVGIWLAVG